MAKEINFKESIDQILLHLKRCREALFPFKNEFARPRAAIEAGGFLPAHVKEFAIYDLSLAESAAAKLVSQVIMRDKKPDIYLFSNIRTIINAYTTEAMADALDHLDTLIAQIEKLKEPEK